MNLKKYFLIKKKIKCPMIKIEDILKEFEKDLKNKKRHQGGNK